MTLTAPPGTASAVAVPNNPPPSAAVNQPSRPDVPDVHTINPPANSAPDNSAPSDSGAGQAPAAPPPAAPPPQRKDQPPDRDPHKFSPDKHSAAGSQSSPGDNNNKKDRAPAATPLPSTGSGGSAPRIGPSDIRQGVQALSGLWDAAKCVSAIAVAIGGVAIPAAKVLKIKQLIKAVGGVGKLVQKITEAFKLIRKGKSVSAAVKEIFSAFGSTVIGIAAEVLGIDAIITNCA